MAKNELKFWNFLLAPAENHFENQLEIFEFF